MGSYKSIVTVGAMGGVLVFFAGILLDVETAKKRRAEREVEEAPSVATVVEGRLVFLDQRASSKGAVPVGSETAPPSGTPATPNPVSATPRSGSTPSAAESAGIDFAAELSGLRDLLERAGAIGPDALRAAEARRADLARFADAAAWPLIAAELERPTSPRGYRPILLKLAAKTGTEGSLRHIEGAYATSPMSAVEALQARGDAAAFRSLARLARKAAKRAEKFTFARALRSFPGTGAGDFALDWLAEEDDLSVACELATQVRHVDRPGLAERLTADLRSELARPERARVVGRLARSLASLEGGAEVLHRMICDERSAELPILGAVFANLRAPELVPAVATSLSAADASRDLQLRFLERNVGARDRDTLETAQEMMLDDDLRGRVQALIDRLD